MIRLTLMLTIAANVTLTALADTPGPQTQVIELPGQKLVFKPTRDDVTVGCVILSLFHSNLSTPLELEAIRVNGAQPTSATIYLKQIEKNVFELPALKIEFSSKELGGPLYLNVKVWFNELTNQYDSFVYEHLPDRYAIVSYCTAEDDDPSKVNARLGANRVAKLEEFKERLGKPFVIKLNQRPLREEWGRYPMVSVGNELSPADVKEIENTVRDRGEKYVRSISGINANQAAVFVGEDTFFHAAREYKVVRSDGTWRVESVKDSP